MFSNLSYQILRFMRDQLKIEDNIISISKLAYDMLRVPLLLPTSPNAVDGDRSTEDPLTKFVFIMLSIS